MHKSLFNPKSLFDGAFWSSKLGHAALASTLAMSAMVVVSTQLSGEVNSFAAIAAPDAGAVMIEIA